MNNGNSQICPHFGKCGGCQKQDQPYADQLAYKQTYLKNLLAQFNPSEFNDIVPSPQIWHFRNKMEFAVTGSIDEPHAGLRPQEKFSQVIDISECRIFYPQVGMVLETVRQWIKESGIQPYDLRKQTGQLRYVSMRHGKVYNEVMVILVMSLSAEEFRQKQDIFSRIKERFAALGSIASAYVCLNSGASDEALAGDLVLLQGKAHVREQVNGIDYQISPRSFFQTNSYCCNDLYRIIPEQACMPGSAILDLFCGCGGISLQVASGASEVIGIDIVEQNINDARENCRANAISNASFVCMDAQQYLSEASASGQLSKFSTLIVDPPRQGLTKKDRKFIVDSGIERLVYVSCNPWNLVQDLKTLLPTYSVAAVHPVDMFPHTPHMEAVVRLARQ
jgi:23S rRNA (uracil-5-)-methyltransferase RumA